MTKDSLASFNDPKMLEILKKINMLKEEIKHTSDEKMKARLQSQLRDEEMHYNILSERRGPV